MESLQQSKHLSTGARGEELARDYLENQGYVILEQNWRFSHRELDIVAFHEDELVVIEVKTRTEPLIEDINLLVNKKKQRNIISAANAYIRHNRINQDVRFDIVIVMLDQEGNHELDHICDAFIPLL